MIVGFMLAGIAAGVSAALLCLVAGFGILAALGFYSLAGMAVMMAGAVFLYAQPQTRHAPQGVGA